MHMEFEFCFGLLYFLTALTVEKCFLLLAFICMLVCVFVSCLSVKVASVMLIIAKCDWRQWLSCQGSKSLHTASMNYLQP